MCIGMKARGQCVCARACASRNVLYLFSSSPFYNRYCSAHPESPLPLPRCDSHNLGAPYCYREYQGSLVGIPLTRYQQSLTSAFRPDRAWDRGRSPFIDIFSNPEQLVLTEWVMNNLLSFWTSWAKLDFFSFLCLDQNSNFLQFQLWIFWTHCDLHMNLSVDQVLLESHL